jgi:mannose-6-phosphate isomerase-like protein (cupin superfamily)
MEIIRRSECPPFIAQDGAVIRELCSFRNASVRNQSVAEATIPPGGYVREHYHRVTEELYYVLNGRGLMRLDGEIREVGPGDLIVILPGRRHRIDTVGSEPLVMLVTCSPGYTVDDQVMIEPPVPG